jgi:hypothetical protein
MSFPAQSDVDIDTNMRRLSRTRTLALAGGSCG